jgi:hypothetical protein
MGLGSFADWVSALAALGALFFTYNAVKIAKEDLALQLVKKPELSFPLVAKEDSNGNVCGYTVICVNTGNKIAVINDVYQKFSNKNNMVRIISKNWDVLKYSMHGSTIIYPNSEKVVLDLAPALIHKFDNAKELQYTFKIYESSLKQHFLIKIKFDSTTYRVTTESIVL